MLFEYEQETVTRTRGVWPVTWQRTYWRPIITGLKGMDFTSTAIGSQKLYIHPWDLTKYSNVWSIEFYEYDNSEDVTVTTSISTKFNTNLEVDASASIPGDILKVGLKYGASLALEESETKQVKYKLDRDFLGKKDVSFEDRLINFNQCDNKFYPKLTETAGVAFELRPVQVEF